MLYLFYIHSDVLSLDLYGDYRTLTGVDWCRRRAAPMTGSARNRLWYLPTSHCVIILLPLAANTLKKLDSGARRRGYYPHSGLCFSHRNHSRALVAGIWAAK